MVTCGHVVLGSICQDPIWLVDPSSFNVLLGMGSNMTQWKEFGSQVRKNPALPWAHCASGQCTSTVLASVLLYDAILAYASNVRVLFSLY